MDTIESAAVCVFESGRINRVRFRILKAPRGRCDEFEYCLLFQMSQLLADHVVAENQKLQLNPIYIWQFPPATFVEPRHFGTVKGVRGRAPTG